MALVESKWLGHRSDMAEILHVNPETLGSWAQRRNTTGFPDPVARTGRGPIWDASEVIRWWVDWKPIKSAKLPRLGWVEPAILAELGLESGGNNGKTQD